MAFNDSYITNVGQDLLTAAASGEKITWIRAATSSWDVDEGYDDDDMKALTSIVQNDSQYTGSGDVSSFIYMDGNPKTASINCQIDNATHESGGPANLFGVWATTNVTYQEEQLVFVARRGGGAQTSISSKSVDPEYKLFVKFGIRLDSFDNAPEVTLTVADGVYATANALQTEQDARTAFDERAVTAHSASSETTGEDQSIYGVKTFENDTMHSGNILPTDGGTYNLGSGTVGWDSVYANYFSGNAETATALETARHIDGVSFDGSSNITHYGECITPAATAIKEVSIPGLSLQQGAVVIIKFAETNTAQNPQLKVNDGSANYIYHHRIDDGATSSNYEHIGNTEVTSWGPGETVMFVFDNTRDSSAAVFGGRWFIISKPRATRYSYISAASIADNSKHPLVFTDPTDSSAGIMSGGIKSLTTPPIDSHLYYQPSNFTLSCPVFSGSLKGHADSLNTNTNVNGSLYNNRFDIANVTGTTTLLWSSTTDVVPSSDYGCSLGYYSSTSGRSRRWNYLYTKYVGSSSSYVSNAYITTISTSKISDATNRHDVLNISCAYTSSTSTYASVISPCDNVFTYSTRTCDLGTVQNAFSNVFTKKLSLAYYVATNGTYGSSSLYSGTYGIHCSGRLCPSTDIGNDLGHSQCRWNYVYARNIAADSYEGLDKALIKNGAGGFCLLNVNITATTYGYITRGSLLSSVSSITINRVSYANLWCETTSTPHASPTTNKCVGVDYNTADNTSSAAYRLLSTLYYVGGTYNYIVPAVRVL